MRVLIDMNLSPKWVEALEKSGLEAAHWSQVGAATDSDPQIMAYAISHRYVVLTSDLDFGAILAATGGLAPSVVQLRTKDLQVEVIGSLVIAVIVQARDELEEGALMTIDTSKLRITSLPIGTSR
jgi:predicted nuclease of predicted toxin-antitoxin system